MKLTILGEPKAIQSVRVRNAGSFIQKYQPKENLTYKNWIRLEVKQQLEQDFVPWSKGIIVKELNFIFPIPKSFSKKKTQAIKDGEIIYKTTKPDLMDNLSKGLFDALEGLLYKNDSQICECQSSSKFYGEIPRIELEIEEVI